MRIFISYARKDQVAVGSLVEELRFNRYDPWIDIEGLVGGAKWDTEIVKALLASNICLIILTPDSVNSEAVKREVNFARDAHKVIIPLLFRDISVPDDLEKINLTDLQFVNFVQHGFRRGMQELLKLLSQSQNAENSEIEKVSGLIIEDEKTQQVTIRQILKDFNINTFVASDLESALELIRSQSFDLITLDMQLDAMDAGGQHGILLLDQIRTYQAKASVVIISHVEWSGRQVRDFFREDQVFDFLPKPFKAGELRRIIEEVLKTKK